MKRLMVVGGDLRMERMAARLEQAGWRVDTLGLRPDDHLRVSVERSRVLVFPYPFAVRGNEVPTLTGVTVYAADVLDAAAPGARIVAGAGLAGHVQAQRERGKALRLLRFSDDKALLDHNAEISAEATVYEAMLRTEKALCDMTVLVTGYGRFGRALALKLRALGTTVWVAARRTEARLHAQSDGMRAIALEDVPLIARRVEMIFNTVPAPVLGEEALHALPKGAWLLELASAPYGFDRDMARELGLSCELLPRLPARYAPTSAGKALAEACDRLLRKGEGE